MINFEKQDIGDGVGRNFSPNESFGLQTGYIFIPLDVGFDKKSSYIEQCFRRERFDIMIEGGGTLVLDCLCTVSVLPEIKFPNKPGGLGSQVVFFTEKVTGSKIIIGTLSKVNESNLNSEGCFHLTKKIGKNIVSIKGDAVNSILAINVAGDSAELSVNVSGNIKIKSKNLRLSNSSLKIGKANESMVLGDELQSQLNDLKARVDGIIDAINNSAVAPGDGGATFKTNLIALTKNLPDSDFDNIKSIVSFLE